MISVTNHWKWAVAALAALPLSTSLVSPVVPVTFDWGSFSASGQTTYGVYDEDNVTPLQTGDVAQLIWTGPDGQADAPNPDGSPGGDDQTLDAYNVQNGALLPPPARNKGYIPFKTFTFDSGGPLNNSIVYIRAWNASDINQATAYGDSSTASLIAGATFNALRWHTNVSWSGGPTQTATPSQTITQSPSPTATETPSHTPTNTATPTITPTTTATATPTATPTPVNTNTGTVVVTASPSPTNTATSTPTATRSPTATATGPPIIQRHFLPLIIHN